MLEKSPTRRASSVGCGARPRALAERSRFRSNVRRLRQSSLDRIYFLTASGKIKFPSRRRATNHGNYIISLQQIAMVVRPRRGEGIDMFSGFAGTELLMDGPRVVGVRTGDRGVGRHGGKRDTFEPGVDIHAKVTILADGVRGNLTKQLIRRSRMTVGRQPQLFALGIKELWDVPAGRLPGGTVIHTLGYPLDQNEFGGGFIYAMSETRLSVGFVAGLDYEDPMFDPHVAFQLKRTALSDLLRGGQMIRTAPRRCLRGMALCRHVRSTAPCSSVTRRGF